MDNEIKHILLKKADSPDIERYAYEKDLVISIGRAHDNTLVIQEDADVVSRHHAEIATSDQTFSIKDLGSTNGLLVNNVKITEQVLMPGDRIQLGTKGPILEFDLDPRPRSLAPKTRLVEVDQSTRQTSSLDASDEILADIDKALRGETSQRPAFETTGGKKNGMPVWLYAILAVAIIALILYFIL